MRAGGTIWAVGLEVPLWRAVAVFRIAALGYAAVLMVGGFHDYARPSVGWVVLAVMAAWTGYATWAYAAPHRRRWPLLALDLAVAAACLGTSLPVVGVAQMHDGAPTLTMIWVAAPVIAWALRGGRRAGAVAALLVGAVDLVVRGALSPATVNGTVLMLVAGVLLGHVARVADQAQRRVQQAARREAAIRERERLARNIHDSVLQVLALVQRRGAELGGEAAELGRLAGEQEATLRALVTDLDPDGPAGPDGTVDLRPLLNRHASADVTVSAPAAPVRLPAPVAGELAAAVAAALDNVRQHAPGARAWVLVEEEPDTVTVTVRDDGPGIPDGRLEQAAAEGRLGVVGSIQGRMRDLGGTATVLSMPGEGTEVELRLPVKAFSPERA